MKHSKIINLLSIVIFLPVGFLCAFSLFRYLTGNEASQAPGLAQINSPAVEAPAPALAALSPDGAVLKPTELKSPNAPLVKSGPQDAGPRQAPIIVSQAQEIFDLEDKAVQEEGEDVVFPPLRVNGIFSSSQGRVAIINDIIVNEGDVVLGARVVRIHESYINMEMNGAQRIIRVK